MARPIWKGHITFGLVNIPVTLFSGETKTDLKFKLLDSRNMARVRYERVNEVTGEEVPWDEIVKGYEYDDDNFVTLTEEDFKKADVEATKSVEIEDFVDRESVSHIYFEKPYYLVPGNKGEKGYVLLRQALKETNMIGIAKVVIHSRQYLASVIPEGKGLILNVMRFQQELRSLEEFDFPSEYLDEYKVAAKELDMAKKLVQSMATEWEPEKYHDQYRESLLNWIRKKAEKGEEVIAPEPEEEGVEAGKIVDFMDVLKKSLEEKGKEGKKKYPAKKRKKTG